MLIVFIFLFCSFELKNASNKNLDFSKSATAKLQKTRGAQQGGFNFGQMMPQQGQQQDLETVCKMHRDWKSCDDDPICCFEAEDMECGALMDHAKDCLPKGVQPPPPPQLIQNIMAGAIGLPSVPNAPNGMMLSPGAGGMPMQRPMSAKDAARYCEQMYLMNPKGCALDPLCEWEMDRAGGGECDNAERREMGGHLDREDLMEQVVQSNIASGTISGFDVNAAAATLIAQIQQMQNGGFGGAVITPPAAVPAASQPPPNVPVITIPITGVETDYEHKTDYEHPSTDGYEHKTDYEHPSMDNYEHKTDYEHPSMDNYEHKTDYEHPSTDGYEHKTEYDHPSMDYEHKTDYEHPSMDYEHKSPDNYDHPFDREDTRHDPQVVNPCTGKNEYNCASTKLPSPLLICSFVGIECKLTLKPEAEALIPQIAAQMEAQPQSFLRPPPQQQSQAQIYPPPQQQQQPPLSPFQQQQQPPQQQQQPPLSPFQQQQQPPQNQQPASVNPSGLPAQNFPPKPVTNNAGSAFSSPSQNSNVFNPSNSQEQNQSPQNYQQQPSYPNDPSPAGMTPGYPNNNIISQPISSYNQPVNNNYPVYLQRQQKSHDQIVLTKSLQPQEDIKSFDISNLIHFAIAGFFGGFVFAIIIFYGCRCNQKNNTDLTFDEKFIIIDSDIDYNGHINLDHRGRDV